MLVCRTLPSRAGAGSYGALSRPTENVSQMHAASAGLAALDLAKNAPVAQLDRALDYESRGQEFESLRARQQSFGITVLFPFPLTNASTLVDCGSNMEAGTKNLLRNSVRRSLKPAPKLMCWSATLHSSRGDTLRSS
jgi:hypothetical protein